MMIFSKKYWFNLMVILVFCTQMIFAQETPEVVITQGHINHVSCVDFSPDGKYIATGSDDKSIRLWYRALQQEYSVLLGHHQNLRDLRFSPLGDKLVSVDGIYLIVWEIPSGKMLYKIKTDAKTFSFIPKCPNCILLKQDQGQVVYNIEKGEIVEELHFGFELTNWMAHPHKPYYIVPEQVDTIMIYDEKGTRIKTLKGTGYYQEIITSPDGSLVAAYTMAENLISIWDFKTGTHINTIKLKHPIHKLIFNGDASAIWTMSWDAKIRVLDTKTGAELMNLNNMKTALYPISKDYIQMGKIGFDLALSRDQNTMGVAITLIQQNLKTGKSEDLRGVLLFDAQTAKKIGVLKGYFKDINHLSVGASERYMATMSFGKQTGLRVWDIKDGEVDRFISTEGFAGASADGRVIAFVERYKLKDPVLKVYQFPRFKEIAHFDVNNTSAICLNADGSRLAVALIKIEAAGFHNYISVWDTKTSKQIKMFEIGSSMDLWSWNFSMSPNGDYIIAEVDDGVRVWSVETGKAIPLQTEATEVDYEHLLAVAPAGNIAVLAQTDIVYNSTTQQVDSDIHLISIDYTTGKIINDFNIKQKGVMVSGKFSADGKYLITGQSGYFDKANFDVIVWDWASKVELCRLKGHYGEVKHLWFGNKGQKIYSAADDGFIKVWDWQKCSLSASLIGMNKLDYIILSPENFYKTNKGNIKGIGFRYNKNLYTYDQFDLKFNRPDKVLESLGVSPYSLKVYKKAWEKRVKRMGYTPEVLALSAVLPKLEILNKDKIPLSTTQQKLNIDISAIDSNVGLDRIKVSVNDVPYPEVKGYDLKQNRDERIQKQLKIPLSQGANLVQVSVMNKNGLESIRESFEINYQPKTVAQKPNLYLFTVGVTNFKNQERNLQYAKKDAEDLIKIFKQSTQYNKVIVQSFYNEKATKKNIQKATRFLDKAGLDDHVMIYVSTHGVLDDSLNYYLAMYDMDFNNPEENGLPYTQIDEMLDGIMCRNRLVLIDACHSGEVDKSEAVARVEVLNGHVKRRGKSGSSDIIRPKAGLRNSFTYMQELFSNLSNQSGATVISAASGYEFALESEEWNNGVFTYAILEGLKNKRADLDGDGKVLISELKWYVIEQVGALTNGQQHPTTRKENDLNDFIIYTY